MKNQKQRGLGLCLTAYLNSHKPGTVFALEEAILHARRKYPDLDRLATSNSLSYLHTKGLVQQAAEFGGMRGTYRTPLKQNGMQSLVDMGERKIIDDLLDAMAKAEPVLKKYARIIDAMNDAK
jgi:hypothetical protein